MIAVVCLGFVIGTGGIAAGLVGGYTLAEFSDAWLLLSLPAATVGPIVAGAILARHPRHPVGWLLLAAAIVSPLAVVVMEWATVIDDAAVVGDLAVWSRLAIWFGLAAWAFVDLPFLLLTPVFFPDGRLPSPRWRVHVGLVVVLVAVIAVGHVVAAAPFGIPADLPAATYGDFGHIDLVPRARAAYAVIEVALALLPLVAIASICSVIVRWRRAGAVERLQLRWVVAGLGVAVPLAAVGIALDSLSGAGEQVSLVGITMVSLGWLALPVSMGIAIVRHQLFDLDRLVSRTLTYVLLSVLLTAIFLGAVVGLSALVQGGIGTDPPTWTIAVSTVVAYSAFAPLRRRVQTAIDRRLHRRIVDAEQTMEQVAHAFEDTVDVTRLTGVIDDAVVRTLAPTTVAVWLPEAPVDAHR